MHPRRGDASVGRSRIKPGWLGRGRGGPSGLREASPVVNVLPRPTAGRNEPGVGATRPSGEANEPGMAGPWEGRAVRHRGGLAHSGRVASGNGGASPLVNVLPRPTGGRNESGVGAMHPSGEANSSGMTGSRQRRAVRYKGGIAHRKCIAPANGCASPIVNVSPLPTAGRNEPGVGAED